MRFARSPLAAAILAGVSMTSAPASATPSSSPSEGLQQRTPAVAAIVLGVDGRPTFVEVSAPTVEQAVQRAARLPGSDGVAIDAPMTALASDDPYRPQQWSLDVLKADSLPAGSPSSLVAVVDSGVRATHEDFAPGQVRCDLGADFTREALGACTDRVGHGTHVAGIVGATANNAKGIAGLAPGTSILPVRVLDSAGSGGSIAVAKGIVHAADRGARVINLSLGGPGGDSALDAAVQYATGRGSLVVVSAGNNRDKGNEVNYPAASPGALSVASTDPGGSSSSFSYSGPTVDLAAPGGASPRCGPRATGRTRRSRAPRWLPLP
jgi:subtilisin family serine protease